MPQTREEEMKFLLTRPLRGATIFANPGLGTIKFLLTRPLRGATGRLTAAGSKLKISTHTPLAGRD